MCPIYEYECEQCKIAVEFIQKQRFTEEELKQIVCDACLTPTFKYIISGGGFRLYGNGYFRGHVKEED